MVTFYAIHTYTHIHVYITLHVHVHNTSYFYNKNNYPRFCEGLLQLHVHMYIVHSNHLHMIQLFFLVFFKLEHRVTAQDRVEGEK